MAVLSRYSKPAPVTRAASRIAPVTRVAISAVAPLMRAAISMVASVPMGALRLGAFPPLAPSAVMVNDKLTGTAPAALCSGHGGLNGADDGHAKPARRHVFRGLRGRESL